MTELNGDTLFKLRVGVATDVGRVRQNNEDCHSISTDLDFFIVADGMGGHQAGDIASKAVATVLPEMAKRHILGIRSSSTHAVKTALRDASAALSREMREKSAGQPGMQGMGATLAMVFVRGAKAYLTNMGDSRIYLFRCERLSQLTEDHSVVALLLKHGDISPAEAKDHPTRGKLSRYMGMEGDTFPDVKVMRLRHLDRLLLCSDGLTGMVSDLQIAQRLKENDEPDAACRALVNDANDAGGTDNITVLVLSVQQRD